MNYLYNGVELPALPDYWDSNQFTHNLIILDNSSDEPAYRLICSENPLRVVGFDSEGLLEYDYNGLDTREGFCDYESGAWVGGSSAMVYGDQGTIFRDYELIWADYNVLKADGTTYLAKSDPVPVGGGTFTIDQASFLAGYKAGAELRRLRKASGGGTNFDGVICLDYETARNQGLEDGTVIKITDYTPPTLVSANVSIVNSDDSVDGGVMTSATANMIMREFDFGYVNDMFSVVFHSTDSLDDGTEPGFYWKYDSSVAYKSYTITLPYDWENSFRVYPANPVFQANIVNSGDGKWMKISDITPSTLIGGMLETGVFESSTTMATRYNVSIDSSSEYALDDGCGYEVGEMIRVINNADGEMYPENGIYLTGDIGDPVFIGVIVPK